MDELTYVYIPAVGQVEVRREPYQAVALGPGEVSVAPRLLGICGSDLHVLHGRHPVGRPPCVPGHEMCAEVVEVGPGVTDFRPGDRVLVDPIHACGECVPCRAGRPNLCEPPMVAGFRAQGYARTRCVVPSANLHLAPADLGWEKLILGEPAACAAHCLSRLEAEHLEDVLVIGAGTIGLSIVQALRIAKAGRITVTEPDPAKRELALDLGADLACAPSDLEASYFSAVIDVVAHQSTLDEAFARVRAGGRVVLMGVPAGALTVPGAVVQRFERDLVGSGMYVPGDFDRAIDWIVSGEFRTEPMVSQIFEIDDAAAAFEAAGRPETIKVMIRLS